MINYTDRLDKAMRKAAWAHEQQNQHRKGSDIPYVMHPFAVMLLASNVTEDEDILIACLLHDVLEDVDTKIYDEQQMLDDFGTNVVIIVKDVTKDSSAKDWHNRSEKYLKHLKTEASDAAIIVCASDKIHNLISINVDHKTNGDELWNRFKTKNANDQLWWYSSILKIAAKRGAPKILIDHLAEQVAQLRKIVA
jgi:(p)ppGpp synthase/HD superfamily hydrolase